jgi:hypothetical protein
MSNQVSLGRRAGLLGISAALAVTMAIPAAVAAQDEAAKVRVLHGVGDAPAVDVYAEDGVLIDALAFPNITDYAEVPAGTYRIRVVPDGATLEEGPVIIDAELTFGAGTMTTVAATGSLAADDIIPQVVLDEPMPSVDGAQLRASHFAYDAPAVDIAPVGGDPVLTEVAFGDTSDHLPLPAGPIDLEIRAAGTMDAVFTIPTLDLAAGNSYSAYAVGLLGDGSFTVVAALDATNPGTAEVRVLHGSPDAPAVDVFANGAAILTDVTFGTLSPFLELPAGTYSIAVAPAGAGVEAAVIGPVDLEFARDTRTTVAATGPLAEIGAQVIADAPETALVRVVHLSADSPRVDIAGDEAGRKNAIVKGLRFGRATDYLQVPAGEYDLEVRPAKGGKNSEVFDIPPFEVEAGKAYAAVAIGSLADDTFTVLLVEE